jgi:hypothetical protein
MLGVTALFVVTSSIALAGEENQVDRRFYATLGTGIDFNRGDFGEGITTNSASIPFFAKFEWEPVTFRASVALLYIDGSDQITGDGANEDPVGAQSRTSYGVGDVTTSLTYTYYPKRQSSLPIVDLYTKVKIHSSAPADLGSSGTDITLGTELAKTWGRVSLFGGTGYRIKTGDLFDNLWLASAGGSVKIAKKVSIGVAYDFRQSSTASGTDSHEVSPYLSIRMNKHVRLTPYGLIGLSDGAPDWGAGTTVSYTF